MNSDMIQLFIDSMLNGGDTSKAIEASERRGQQEAVRNQHLPILTNDSGVPNEFLLKGLDANYDYYDNVVFEARMKIRNNNIIEWTKAQYEKMGIEILSKVDDLFYAVKLPEGWEVKSTSHTMWNDVFDNKGRKRVQFFYKAAFYDRSSFSNFCTRFRTSVDRTVPADTDYDIWKKANFVGKVYDGEKVIYQTEEVPAPIEQDYPTEEKITDKLSKELNTFIEEHYPNYKDINAYWDLEEV